MTEETHELTELECVHQDVQKLATEVEVLKQLLLAQSAKLDKLEITYHPNGK